MCTVEVFKDASGQQQKFYNGPSPDEVALVEFAASRDFVCTHASDDIINVEFPDYGENADLIENTGGNSRFKVFRKINFTSDRKRMSILVRDPSDGKIKLFIKGADSTIWERLDKNQLFNEDIEEQTDWFLETAGRKGLRTLLVAMKVVEEKEKDAFLEQCRVAEE